MNQPGEVGKKAADFRKSLEDAKNINKGLINAIKEELMMIGDDVIAKIANSNISTTKFRDPGEVQLSIDVKNQTLKQYSVDEVLTSLDKLNLLPMYRSNGASLIFTGNLEEAKSNVARCIDKKNEIDGISPYVIHKGEVSNRIDASFTIGGEEVAISINISPDDSSALLQDSQKYQGGYETLYNITGKIEF